jgi:hypothetical protein
MFTFGGITFHKIWPRESKKSDMMDLTHLELVAGEVRRYNRAGMTRGGSGEEALYRELAGNCSRA